MTLRHAYLAPISARRPLLGRRRRKKPSKASPKASSPPSKSTPKEVRQTNDAKDARIRELEQTLGGFLPVFAAPDGYEENDETRAPNLNIPIQDGYYQPAHWVKQLDNGQIAAFPKNTPSPTYPTSATSTTHLHGADDSDEDPILPMQPWLLELLTGPTNAFNTLYKEAQKRSNWETLAEIQRFRELEHTIIDTQKPALTFLQAQIRGAKQAQERVSRTSGGDTLDRTVANLRTLPNMGRRNFGEFRQNSQKRKFQLSMRTLTPRGGVMKTGSRNSLALYGCGPG